MMRRLFFASALVLSTSGHAFADEPAASTPSASTPPAPAVKLELTPAPSGPWTLKITNNNETPVRLAADARLLSLEIANTTATSGTITKCSLPDDARPSTDEGYELVMPSKRSWTATFDPMLYCFGSRAALVKDASVKARFGWRSVATKGGANASTSPPFAVTPVGASVGKLTPEKELESDPVTIPETVTAVPKPPPPPASSDAPPPPPNVYLTVPETMDAAKGQELSTTVSLVNESDRPITLLFRPDMVNFALSGPAGTVACGAPRVIGSPPRDLFITVGVKARTSLGVLFTSTCPAGTFDHPGLYRLTPRLDTTNASGRHINVKSWDGVATSKSPLLLRIRQPKRPSITGPRPSLD